MSAPVTHENEDLPQAPGHLGDVGPVEEIVLVEEAVLRHAVLLHLADQGPDLGTSPTLQCLNFKHGRLNE